MNYGPIKSCARGSHATGWIEERRQNRQRADGQFRQYKQFFYCWYCRHSGKCRSAYLNKSKLAIAYQAISLGSPVEKTLEKLGKR
jgi:hypothetical protein